MDQPLLTIGTRVAEATLAPRRVIARPRVLLVRPPQLFSFGVYPRGPRLSVPVGLLALGAFVRYVVADRLSFRDAMVRLFFCRLFYRPALSSQSVFERS
jgi:hypothetical protein